MCERISGIELGKTLVSIPSHLIFDLFLKGADHLTVTWKVDEGVYQHVDVREEGKENAFSLGRSLWIDSEVCYSIKLSCEGLKNTNKALFVIAPNCRQKGQTLEHCH